MRRLVDLLEDFREESDDIQEQYLWSRALVTRWLNDAITEACVRANLIYDNTTEAVCKITVAEDVKIVTLHSSIISVERAYLLDADGNRQDLSIHYGRKEIDALDPEWQFTKQAPTAIIVDDKTAQLNSISDKEYTLWLEVYRTNVIPMSSPSHYPDIHPIHHDHLVDWALYRAYSRRNTKKYDPQRAKEHYDRFEKYFGTRPMANRRKAYAGNAPHRIATHH